MQWTVAVHGPKKGTMPRPWPWPCALLSDHMLCDVLSCGCCVLMWCRISGGGGRAEGRGDAPGRGRDQEGGKVRATGIATPTDLVGKCLAGCVMEQREEAPTGCAGCYDAVPRWPS